MPRPSHLALVRAIEDLTRAQRGAGAGLSRALGSSRGAIAVVRALERGPQQVGELAQALRGPASARTSGRLVTRADDVRPDARDASRAAARADTRAGR